MRLTRAEYLDRRRQKDGPVTLAGLRRAHPDLFHPNQDWFNGQAFMDTPLPDDAPTKLPVACSYEGESIHYATVEVIPFVPAVVLANLYVSDPDHPIWLRYLWTGDTDHLGQRVYIGENGKGLEIHRHIRISERFGVPRWGGEG